MEVTFIAKAQPVLLSVVSEYSQNLCAEVLE